VLIRNLIILQFLATLAYFIAAVLANYTALYQEFSFSHTISYEVAKFIFIAAAEFGIIGFLFLRWFFEMYTIYPAMVVHEWGVVWKRKKVLPLRRPVAVSVHHSPLARAFKYANLIIQDSVSQKPIALAHVPTPETYAKFIADQNREKNSDNENETPQIEDFLRKREHEKLEFKTSLRWDARENKLNRSLEKAAMKTVAAFLNSDGGHLVIGIGNEGDILGLEYDYGTLPKKDADGFENHFTNVFNEMIGPEFRRFVKLTFHRAHGKEVCVMRVAPSVKPAYMKSENGERFFIRTGNSTTALQVRDIAPYIQSRWTIDR